MSGALAIREGEETAFSEEVLSAFAEVRDNYSGAKIGGFLSYARTHDGAPLDVVAGYFEGLNGSGFAASTIRTKRQAVKARLRRYTATWPTQARGAFEAELRLLDSDPTTKCPGGAAPALAPWKVCTAAEYERLIRQARSDRQRRFLEFLYTTGARVSEMTGVRLADCRAEGGAVAVKLRGKGTAKLAYKERQVWIPKAMYERIRATFQGETFLFETDRGKRYSRSYVSNQLGRLTLAVIGRRLSAHCFRHTFCTRYAKATGRTKAVATYVGHADTGVFDRYYNHDVLSVVDVLGPEVIGA